MTEADVKVGELSDREWQSSGFLDLPPTREQMAAELSLLRRQNEKLVEVLKPFAKAGESWLRSDGISRIAGEEPDDGNVVVLRPGTMPCEITVGHLRNAAAAFRSAGAAGNGEERG